VDTASADTQEEHTAMRFLHDFGGNLRCELIVTDNPPPKGESHIVRTNWYGGKPSKEQLEEYHRFMKSVNQTAVNRWQIKLAYAVQTDPRRWELWIYEPHTEPVLGKVIES
jgi:hypothetical protein